MNSTDKALYFCHTHTNLFLQQLCMGCRRGMCHTCIHHHPTLCASCLKNNFLGAAKNPYKKEFGWMLIGGIIALIIYLVIDYSSTNENYFTINVYLDSLVAFLFGSCIVATRYMLRDKDFLSEALEIPFVGFKVSIVLFVFLFISGFPILYILYKYLHYFIKSIQFERTQ